MVPPSSGRVSRAPPYSRTSRLSTRTGLSPALARLSRRFRFLPRCHWPGPRSLAATDGVSPPGPKAGRLLLMSFPPGTEMFQFPGFASAAYGFSGGSSIAGGGCPIRRSPDQSLLAAPQGFSQRATSFIASWRQGIHQMPLLSSTPASHHHRVHPMKSATSRGPRPAVHGTAEPGEGAVAGGFQRLPQRAVLARNGPHTHARCAPCPQTEETKKKGRTRDLPMPVAHDARKIAPPCPQRAPRHHLTMSKQQRPATPLPKRRTGTPGGPGPT